MEAAKVGWPESAVAGRLDGAHERTGNELTLGVCA